MRKICPKGSSVQNTGMVLHWKPLQRIWILFHKFRCVRNVVFLDFKSDSGPISMRMVGNSMPIVSEHPYCLAWMEVPGGLPGTDLLGRPLCALVHTGQSWHWTLPEPANLLQSGCSVAAIHGGIFAEVDNLGVQKPAFLPPCRELFSATLCLHPYKGS